MHDRCHPMTAIRAVDLSAYIAVAGLGHRSGSPVWVACHQVVLVSSLLGTVDNKWLMVQLKLIRMRWDSQLTHALCVNLFLSAKTSLVEWCRACLIAVVQLSTKFSRANCPLRLPVCFLGAWKLISFSRGSYPLKQTMHPICPRNLILIQCH